jgi:hypothetical protein
MPHQSVVCNIIQPNACVLYLQTTCIFLLQPFALQVAL